ncbi:prephenate dehydratase [Erythrobacter sp. SCSIO 43205]|uniref:prephenate dehydratase n=1 Tax=Erythrobacter sp. SCSIO 43205 TaxID=2779361 RepID=UPI001CA99956|nr:prephenate dehydratase [Erythrobacter sp. SCSIO 43205]UAB78128.1 prephenate dehydratase [Erythrobacter sp. SCSIO 43205]
MLSFPDLAMPIVEKLKGEAAKNPAKAVAFQGSPGANSHRAALEACPDLAPLPCFGFANALDAVKDGEAGRAIIPIENSHNGRVADIHFLLPESGLSIVGEYFLPIHHALMAPAKGDERAGSLDSIKAAYSHPQALGQSRKFLREHDIVPLNFVDTAGAAAHVAELGDPTIGAIAPAIAAELYGLEIVKDHVEDAHDNMTRFVILADKPTFLQADPAKPAMTTFIFEVKNIPAALYKVLGGFATNGVNMTKLESYQVGASFSATMFYADIIGVPGDPAVDRALEECAFHSKELRILGTYEQARKRG